MGGSWVRHFAIVALCLLIVAGTFATAPTLSTVYVTYYIVNADGTYPPRAPHAQLLITYQSVMNPNVMRGPYDPQYDNTTGTMTWTVPQNCWINVTVPGTLVNGYIYQITTADVNLNSVVPNLPAPQPSWAALFEPAILAGTTLKYWRGDKTWQTLNTSVVPEVTNLYWTQARFDTAYTAKNKVDSFNSRTGAVALSSSDVTTALTFTPEPAITGGTIGQYWRGDKSWQTLPATDLSPYYTSMQVDTLLTGKLGTSATAANSSQLEGHAASYFQVAGSYLTSESDPRLPAASTSGNVLTSNGSVWTSATPAAPDLSGLVPYTGATGDVDSGTHLFKALGSGTPGQPNAYFSAANGFVASDGGANESRVTGPQVSTPKLTGITDTGTVANLHAANSDALNGHAGSYFAPASAGVPTPANPADNAKVLTANAGTFGWTAPAAGGASYPTPDGAGWWHSNGSASYSWSTPSAADVGALAVAGTAADSSRLGGNLANTYAPLASPALTGNPTITGANNTTAALAITGGNVGQVPLKVNAASGQTANIQEWQVNGTNKMTVDSNGNASIIGEVGAEMVPAVDLTNWTFGIGWNGHRMTTTTYTAGNPTVITSAAHGIPSGIGSAMGVLIEGVSGTMGTALNGNTYTVTYIDATTFSVAFDSTGLSGSGGTATVTGTLGVKSYDGTGTMAWTAGGTALTAYATYKTSLTVSAMPTGLAFYTLGNQSGLPLGSAATFSDYLTPTSAARLVITPSATATRFTMGAISILPLTAGQGSVTVDGGLNAKGLSAFDGLLKVKRLAVNYTPTSSGSTLEVQADPLSSAGAISVRGAAIGAGVHGAGIQFVSNGGTAMFQLDGGGSLVFRSYQSNMYFDYTAGLVFRGGASMLQVGYAGSTGGWVFNNLDTAAVPMTVNAKTGQTALLQDWRVNTSSKASIDKDGNGAFPAVATTAGTRYVAGLSVASGTGFGYPLTNVIGAIMSGETFHEWGASFYRMGNTATVAWTNVATAHSTADASISRQNAGIIQAGGASADATGSFAAASHITQSANASTMTEGSISELITLSTSGTTTDSSADLLPANSIILGVTARVTTTITTATDWKLGDGTIAGRFTAANSTLTAGTTDIGTLMADQTGTSGPRQVSAAKLRITTTGTPGAGVIRVTVFYRRFVAPTS